MIANQVKHLITTSNYRNEAIKKIKKCFISFTLIAHANVMHITNQHTLYKWQNKF